MQLGIFTARSLSREAHAAYDGYAPRPRSPLASDSRASNVQLTLIGAHGERPRHRHVRDGVEARAFDPARDIAALVRKAELIGDIGLLIVDPIVSAVGGDSHKNAETRRSLQPLVDLGARLQCAILGISHFTKGTSGREPVGGEFLA
jgi:hypothetical protein